MRWLGGRRSKNQIHVPEDLANFIVNTEADGQLSKTGIFQSSEGQLKRMVQNIVAFFRQRPAPHRLMFYCHGGLVPETVAWEGIRERYRTFLANGIYPVFFIWESSLQQALEDHLQRSVAENFRQMAVMDKVVDTIVDELIEEAAKLFPGPWEAMKRRGMQVFASHGGGWHFVLLLSKALKKAGLHAEIHLVGHSAGSIVLYTFLKQLLEGKGDFYPYLKGITCTLYAPACTVQQFEDAYVRAVDHYLLKRFFLYTLSDKLERSDASVPYYSKSILYLVSRGLEAQSGEKPIFGMEIYAKNSPALKRIMDSGKGAWVVADEESRPVCFDAGREVLELISLAKQHGGFSYDPATLNSTGKTIISRNWLPEPFQ